MEAKKLVKIRSMQEILYATDEMLKARGDRPQFEIRSLPDFNTKIWGLKEKELVVVSARTSHGKSTFINQIAMDFCEQNIPVLYLSLEMSEEEIMERLFCYKQSISNQDLLRGRYKIDSSYQSKFAEFCLFIENHRLKVMCGIGDTWKDILELYDMLDFKPKVIILDYVQAIKVTGKHSYEEMNEFIRKAREIAVLNNLCFIMVSQINRTGAGETPGMHQNKGTGVLEEHADRCFLLYWPFKTDQNKPMNEYELIIAKNRNGRTGNLKLYFQPEYYRFSEAMISQY